MKKKYIDDREYDRNERVREQRVRREVEKNIDEYWAKKNLEKKLKELFK